MVKKKRHSLEEREREREREREQKHTGTLNLGWLDKEIKEVVKKNLNKGWVDKEIREVTIIIWTEGD